MRIYDHMSMKLRFGRLALAPCCVTKVIGSSRPVLADIACRASALYKPSVHRMGHRRPGASCWLGGLGNGTLGAAALGAGVLGGLYAAGLYDDVLCGEQLPADVMTERT